MARVAWRDSRIEDESWSLLRSRSRSPISLRMLSMRSHVHGAQTLAGNQELKVEIFQLG